MKYDYGNIGDIIQSIAARRFLPQVNYYAHREHLDSFSPDPDNNVTVKMILNGCFMNQPLNFPPSEIISPLLVSINLYITARDLIISTERSKKYLIEHGPVGCRDKSTLKFLLENNIPAYYSGCLTLTLKGDETIKSAIKDKYILCVDVSNDVFNYVRRKADKIVYRISKNITNPYVDTQQRFDLAKKILYLYHNASAVITTNLHTALPCLAFNTPVCLIEQEKYDGRFDGPDEWLNHCKRENFISGKFYDINNPPDNPREFVKYRDSLIEVCKNFTGFDSASAIFEDSYRPEIDSLIETLISHYNWELEALNYMGGRKLLKASAIILKKIIFKSIHKIFHK